MRYVPTALIVAALFLAAPQVHAQVAHSNTNCGCESCQASCGSSCGDCGILSSLGGMLGIGCDGRHQVYKAALCRNSFDKKFQLPIAYYRHILPFYRHDRCCTCGTHVPASGNCPTCAPHEQIMGEEIIDMQEVPQPAPPEPTPAAYHTRPAVPGPVVPGAVVPPKSTSQDRMVLAPTAPARQGVVRQASATTKAAVARSTNPLR